MRTLWGWRAGAEVKWPREEQGLQLKIVTVVLCLQWVGGSPINNGQVSVGDSHLEASLWPLSPKLE